ncbi:MAG: WGxxGxxG family protein [Allosphingosinicella sp.]
MNTKLNRALAAVALLALASPVYAKGDVRKRAEEIAEQANDVQQQAGELANDVANAEATDDRDSATRAGTVDNRQDRDDDDGDGGKWGLLGLLGLAGLLGLRRRDDRVRTDPRVDPRL